MRRLCYRIDYTSTEGDSPAALGNRIAAAAIALGRTDGANERQRYADPDYRSVNSPLVVREGTIAMADPSRWQPLALDRLIAQNGVPIPGKVQRFVGSRWGHVRAFALPPAPDGMPADPGTPPAYGDPAFVAAAVAAWGAKRHYDSARPISMIRYLAARNELPLVPGLIERVTQASSAPGGRHEGLRAHVGELALRSWLANPRPGRAAGVGWVPASAWVPYQRPTFVTPAFAGYVSGHSTFSRAAAEVLTAATGNPYFPGGLFEWKVKKGALVNESGPTTDVKLQWATYFDAADDAGISRLYGGIHISADDLAGRRLGARCGLDAWARALRYFDGTARS
jgi:hypothetical protein